MKTITYYLFIFFIYSIIGWITETTYTSIRQKKILDRGFLIGPYCPIYGFGAVGGILYLTQYKDNIFTVFILGLILACFMEYITSYIMEKIFKARWWDYSDRLFNLNGRICGANAILFGITAIVIIYILQPIINYIINKINYKILLILTIILFIVFLTDFIISSITINKLRKNLSNIEIKKDSTSEIKKQVLDALTIIKKNGKTKKNILQKRIIKAYPNIDLKKLINIRNDKYEKLKGLFKK